MDFLDTRISNWTSEFKNVVDSPNFSWLEIKPMISDHLKLVSYITRLPLFIHMASAIFCMGCSAIYHLWHDFDPKVSSFLARLDYAGISVLIAGSNTPPIWYSFYCEENSFYRILYLSLIYLSCMFCFVVLLVPTFDKPQFMPLRGIMFIICGLLGVLPIFHINALDKKYIDDFEVFPWALGGAFYIIGAIIYMLRIPERCKPKLFDHCGSSHNIFHFFIIAAVLVHYKASV